MNTCCVLATCGSYGLSGIGVVERNCTFYRSETKLRFSSAVTEYNMTRMFATFHRITNISTTDEISPLIYFRFK